MQTVQTNSYDLHNMLMPKPEGASTMSKSSSLPSVFAVCAGAVFEHSVSAVSTDKLSCKRALCCCTAFSRGCFRHDFTAFISFPGVLQK